MKNLKWKLLTVVGVIVFAAAMIYPPIDTPSRKGRISLGLDLKGGVQLVLRVKTGEGTKVIEIDPDNAANPVTVRKSKHGEDGDEEIDSSTADFFQSDIFSQFPNASDNSLKAKLQQLQEARESSLTRFL